MKSLPAPFHAGWFSNNGKAALVPCLTMVVANLSAMSYAFLPLHFVGPVFLLDTNDKQSRQSEHFLWFFTEISCDFVWEINGPVRKKQMPLGDTVNWDERDALARWEPGILPCGLVKSFSHHVRKTA